MADNHIQSNAEPCPRPGVPTRYQPPWQHLAVGVVLLLLAVFLYRPALNRVFATDHIWYLAELEGKTALSDGLRLCDYAVSRRYWKGDEVLFRPLTFALMAVQNSLFSYDHTKWNVVNLALHVLLCWLLYALLYAIHPSPLAGLFACFFAAHPAAFDLATWHHLAGYMAGVALILVALMAALRLIRSVKPRPRAIVAVYVAVMSLALFFYEVLAGVCCLALAMVFGTGAVRGVRSRRRNRGEANPATEPSPSSVEVREPPPPEGGESLPAPPEPGRVHADSTDRRTLAEGWRIGGLLVVPLLIYLPFYAVHAVMTERFWFVGSGNVAMNDWLRVGQAGMGVVRTVAHWFLVTLLPGGLRFVAEAFLRTKAELSLFPPSPGVLASAAVLAGLVIACRPAFAWRLFCLRLGLVALPLLVVLGYAACYSLGRPDGAAVFSPYCFYLPAMFFIVAFYAAGDWTALRSRRRQAVVTILALGTLVNAAVTRQAARQVHEANADADRYLRAVADFVAEHREDPGFSFRIVNPPDAADPWIGMVIGYPDDEAARAKLLRLSHDILFVRYTRTVPPKVVAYWDAQEGRVTPVAFGTGDVPRHGRKD